MASYVVPADYSSSSQKKKASDMFDILKLRIALNRQTEAAMQDANVKLALGLQPGISSITTNAANIRTEFDRRDYIIANLTAFTGSSQTANVVFHELQRRGELNRFIALFPRFQDAEKAMPAAKPPSVLAAWEQFLAKHPAEAGRVPLDSAIPEEKETATARERAAREAELAEMTEEDYLAGIRVLKRSVPEKVAERREKFKAKRKAMEEAKEEFRPRPTRPGQYAALPETTSESLQKMISAAKERDIDLFLKEKAVESLEEPSIIPPSEEVVRERKPTAAEIERAAMIEELMSTPEEAKRREISEEEGEKIKQLLASEDPTAIRRRRFIAQRKKMRERGEVFRPFVSALPRQPRKDEKPFQYSIRAAESIEYGPGDVHAAARKLLEQREEWKRASEAMPRRRAEADEAIARINAQISDLNMVRELHRMGITLPVAASGGPPVIARIAERIAERRLTPVGAPPSVIAAPTPLVSREQLAAESMSFVDAKAAIQAAENDIGLDKLSEQQGRELLPAVYAYAYRNPRKSAAVLSWSRLLDSVRNSSDLANTVAIRSNLSYARDKITLGKSDARQGLVKPVAAIAALGAQPVKAAIKKLSEKDKNALIDAILTKSVRIGDLAAEIARATGKTTKDIQDKINIGIRTGDMDTIRADLVLDVEDAQKKTGVSIQPMEAKEEPTELERKANDIFDKIKAAPGYDQEKINRLRELYQLLKYNDLARLPQRDVYKLREKFATRLPKPKEKEDIFFGEWNSLGRLFDVFAPGDRPLSDIGQLRSDLIVMPTHELDTMFDDAITQEDPDEEGQYINAEAGDVIKVPYDGIHVEEFTLSKESDGSKMMWILTPMKRLLQLGDINQNDLKIQAILASELGALPIVPVKWTGPR